MRESINYPGYTKTVPAVGVVLDFEKLLTEGARPEDTDELFVIPARIEIEFDKFLILTFKAWRSVEQFEKDQEPVTAFQRKLRVNEANFATFYSENTAIIDLIKSTALEFMGIAPAKYNARRTIVDLESLEITIEAKHNKRNQTVTEYVRGAEEFEKAKIANPEFTTALIGFAWTYGRAESRFLNRLKPGR